MEKQKQTPLIDLLESIPRDAVLIIEHDQFSSSFRTVGRLCREAAAELRRLHVQAAAALAKTAQGQYEMDEVSFEDNNGASRKTPSDCQSFGANGVPAAVWVNGRRYIPEHP